MSREGDPVCLGYLALLHSSRTIQRYRDKKRAKELADQVFPLLLSQCIQSNETRQYLHLNKHKLFILGSLYTLGLGCLKDPVEGFKCFQLSSLEDFPRSISSLGNCYALGIGVNKDPEAAFHLFRRAADLGDPVGQYNLSICYRHGLGTPPSYWKALESFFMSIRQGYVSPISPSDWVSCIMYLTFFGSVIAFVLLLVIIFILI
jgi:TPR repeat protein